MASMARGAKRRHAVISKKMLILFSASLSCVVLLVIFSLFRFHSPKPPISISISRVVFDGPPKIAFLFLVRRNLPLDFLWDAFFQVSHPPSFLFFFWGNCYEYLSSKLSSIFRRTSTFRDSRYTFIRRLGLCWMSQPPGRNSSTVDKSVIAFRWHFVVEKAMPTYSSTYFPFSNCWKD